MSVDPETLPDEYSRLTYEIGQVAGALRAVRDIAHGDGTAQHASAALCFVKTEDFIDLMDVLASVVATRHQALDELYTPIYQLSQREVAQA